MTISGHLNYKVYSPETHDLESQESFVEWRRLVKEWLNEDMQGLSMVSGRKLRSPELHEGIFPRRYVPKGISWHYRIYSGPNLFLISAEEHRPIPPTREQCYWLACAYWGKDVVDNWIESLPFKSTPDVGYTEWREEIGAVLTRYDSQPWLRDYIYTRLDLL